MSKIAKYRKYKEQLDPLLEFLGLNAASIEQTLTVYPDEFIGMEFSEEEESDAKNARAKFSEEKQKKLIKAFCSHDWLVSSDIYGHDGLSCGGSCKSCGRKFRFPEPDIRPSKDEKPSEDKQDWRRKFRNVSENFILTYHYIYGRHKRFGGRITKCKGEKK